jgi:hypothetical protein
MKKIISGIVVLAIAAVAAFNVNLSLNQKKNDISALSLANVEALAGENGGDCTYNQVTLVQGTSTTKCVNGYIHKYTPYLSDCKGQGKGTMCCPGVFVTEEKTSTRCYEI